MHPPRCMCVCVCVQACVCLDPSPPLPPLDAVTIVPLRRQAPSLRMCVCVLACVSLCLQTSHGGVILIRANRIRGERAKRKRAHPPPLTPCLCLSGIRNDTRPPADALRAADSGARGADLKDGLPKWRRTCLIYHPNPKYKQRNAGRDGEAHADLGASSGASSGARNFKY